jgi:cytochrome oxidase Cu insertion factor (SCO1/SenC/PrrC family)
MRRELILVVAIAALFVLSACTSTQADEPQAASASSAGSASSETVAEDNMELDASDDEHPATMDEESSENQEQDSEQPSTDSSAGQTAVDRPSWQNLALTNAKTGETFTLGDFEGKTVFVEPMATWCSNCRRQLNNVRDASFQLTGDDVVLVALSVETNIDDRTLANYASSQAFDWVFAVVTPELLGELVDEFGRAITNPPATPHFIIRADGTTTDLVTGIDPAADLLQQIAAAQG